MRLFRRRVIYRCGNCGETFKREDELHAHMTPVCPLVAIERQVARWNEEFLRRDVADEDNV